MKKNKENIRYYSCDEWDFEWEDGIEGGGFSDRVYIDKVGNRITGVLEGFYGYDSSEDQINNQYVYKGKVVEYDTV